MPDKDDKAPALPPISIQGAGDIVSYEEVLKMINMVVSTLNGTGCSSIHGNPAQAFMAHTVGVMCGAILVAQGHPAPHGSKALDYFRSCFEAGIQSGLQGRVIQAQKYVH